MNKRIFTLLTAGLLLGGPALNVAYAADPDLTKKEAVSYENNKTALANGMSFYLGASESALLKVSEVLTTKDNKKVVSFAAADGDVTTGTVFTIRNYSSNSFELWTNVNGVAYQVVTDKEGKELTSATDKNLSDLNVKFAVSEGKLKFKGLYTVTVPTKEVETNLQAFSYKEGVDAKYLNDYNSNGTTLSFDYTTDELVGNLFDKVIPVSFTKEVTPAQASDDNKLAVGTYFVKGDSKKVKAFVDAAKAYCPEDSDSGVSAANAAAPDGDAVLTAAQEITFLALDPSDRYDINGRQDGEGYALYWMKGSVATANADSCSNATFTITAKDVLNEDGKLMLTVQYKKKDQTEEATDVYVAAVKPSVSDTKTYVTTVLTDGSKYSAIHPQLGENSYLDASVLLKKNVENVVNIYFTSSNKSENDEADSQTEYHKYLTIDPADGSSLSAAAYNSVDFTMPVSQWIVSGFNGKYEFTLTNRETGKNLVLRLQPNGAEGGYKIVSAEYDGSDARIDAGKGVTSELVLGKDEASVKFNTIATTRTDGYKVFSDTQIAEGFKMTFNGKDALFGEKTLYAVVDKDKKTMKASTEAENLIVLYPERVKGTKDHSTKSLRGVEDYVISTRAFAYLNDKGEVALKANGDTLVVPTYVLRYTEAKGDDAKYLNGSASIEKPAAEATEFAVVKNSAGTYSLVAVSETASGNLDYASSIGTDAKMAKVETTTMAIAFSEDSRYVSADDINKTYANVEILDANPFNPSLAAKPRHASFDNRLGSINYQLNKNGFDEGILSAESMIFWLDTADSKAKTPSFYISKGIEVAEGEEKPAERMFMFNPTDSLNYFVEGSAQQYTDKKYYLEGSGESDVKVIFRPAILEGVDTIATTVNGEAVKVVKELNDDKSVKSTARLDAFKFNITLAGTADDEYVVSSQRKIDNQTAYVYALNGKLGLTTAREKAMVFTLGTEVPTGNESIDAEEAAIAIVAGNGVVTIQGAAGKAVVITNILGKVVAETVLTSDNAAIAVPAGIVAVAVEGEKAVKAIVK
ncbi:DUF6383 domain-containing protein [Parabacteroides sp. ZJ-118]|uniref:DUF6383 domain-containing protein n=1 Tax=Parabacteroides sp. ZJ-118 TaxID=2709398 RepID=UPI0013EABA8F|nr:DUF6383 domain-containing protein [Parabacteroides sp. ZJ-118]